MLLTPWCQKLEHYHFKSNLEFEAKEIKITVVLFLALKPTDCSEAWNSLVLYCVPYINASCFIKQFSLYVYDSLWVPLSVLYLG